MADEATRTVPSARAHRGAGAFQTQTEAPTVPEDLSTLDDDALATLLTDLEETFDQLHDDGSRDIPLFTDLADQIDALRAEQQRRDTESERLDDELAAQIERVHPTGSDEPGESGDEGDQGETDDDGGDDEAAEPAEPDAVTAAADRRRSTRPTLAAVARRAPRPRLPARQPQVTITAAADLPGISPGTHIDLDQVAQALHDRARTLADGHPRVPVARIEIPYPQTQRLGTDGAANAAILDAVIGQPDAAALVASGGWCAPSQPVFELFDIGPDATGLFDVPTFGGTIRAGIMVPTFYGIGDVAGALWTWTEADDIDAGENPPAKTKPCLKIPCPTWDECRLEAEGLCVTHGNLSDRAWPELTRSFINVVMGAHLHRISAAKIAKLTADTTAVTPGATMLVSDAAADLLGVIELQAADMRSQYRVGTGRSIDVLLPDWTRAVLRANLAMRAGVDLLSVTDAQITRWLTDRGIRPQFAADYQPLYDGAPATEWPTNLEFAIWFSGSYFTVDGGTIDLGVVRDSTLNETNDFTAAWSEQFFQLCRRGPQGRKVTVPLSVDGVTGCCAAA